jgi:cytochrome c oxidase subunit 1
MSDSANLPGAGMDLWIVGVSMATVGALLLAGCQLATIVARRAPGITMLRMPVFTWAMLATSRARRIAPAACWSASAPGFAA